MKLSFYPIITIGDNMIHKLANFLTLEMKRQGLSAVDLAKRCNHEISADYIRKIKNTVPQSVTIDTLDILAKGLHMSLKQLLTESNIIDDYGNNGLSVEESNQLIDHLSQSIYPQIDSSSLSSVQKVELANQINDYIQLISRWYRSNE